MIDILCLLIVICPLIGSIVAGPFGKQIGRRNSHLVTITLVGLSFLFSVIVACEILSGHTAPVDTNLYTWANGGELFHYAFHIGFLIDQLTAIMLLVVTFVSLLVHIYSIGYMVDDDGYQRFFSYISLFTFMMLMLVTGNNFLQLFFGWEGVGLVSYLLIGFWYDKESALEGSLKAFLVNRVGDFGFILGIGLIFAYTGTLDYSSIFKLAPVLSGESISLFTGHAWPFITVASILLFIGAMGKSAQVPLHVWLPESMEGPTPISALIHAATMVTAGVFMVARLSPLIEYSTGALSFILVIGAIGALFTGLLAIVMNDIKRVIAYSTLSQLGYMMVAMGASAYSAGIFHLLTHACFKALLFLGAGSVIIALHHEQDMRKMGGIWRKMPITWFTFLIGSLALCAIPPFAGFFSKDTIIEAAKITAIPGGKFAWICVTIGAMVTAIYTFRAFFMTFHGSSRMDAESYSHVKESPWVIWLPLVLLAIPSIIIGYILYMPMLFNTPALLSSAVFVMPEHNVLAELGKEIHSATHQVLEAPFGLTFWLSLAGVFIAWLCYLARPEIPGKLARSFSRIYQILVNKYGFDAFNNTVFVNGSRKMGQFFYNTGDKKLIDGFLVNGSSALVKFIALKGRALQSGYLYHYAAAMVLGLILFLCWLL